MKNIFLRWGPALVLMLIIFVVSAQPKTDIPQFGFWDLAVKKLAHLLGYGLLAVAMGRGVRGAAPFAWRQLVWALALTVIYALTDEYHQTFVAGRGGNLIDVGIDGLGATLGLAIRLGWEWRFPRPRRRAVPSPSQSQSSRR